MARAGRETEGRPAIQRRAIMLYKKGGERPGTVRSLPAGRKG